MPDQKLIANDSFGNVLDLGAVAEADRTSSVQAADRMLRAELLEISEALEASYQSLAAATAAIWRAVNAFNASSEG